MVALYLFARCLLDFVSRVMITVPLVASFCVLDIVNASGRVEPQVVGMLSFSLSGRQACLFRSAFSYIALPVSSFGPPLEQRLTAVVFSRDIWIKFVKPMEPAQEKYCSVLPGEPQPHWLRFVCLRPTIVFRLILAEWWVPSQWEWCISSSASIKAACCGWSQTPLCRDLSSRLPKRGDWIHLLTNEEGLQIVYFPSYTSTC